MHDVDHSDETTLLTATAVDDDWWAGYLGRYRYRGGSAVWQCDDMEYILSTFGGTQRRDAAETGTFRTAELILAAYDALRA